MAPTSWLRHSRRAGSRWAVTSAMGSTSLTARARFKWAQFRQGIEPAPLAGLGSAPCVVATGAEGPGPRYPPGAE